MIHKELCGGGFMNVSYRKTCGDIWVQGIMGTLNSINNEFFLP